MLRPAMLIVGLLVLAPHPGLAESFLETFGYIWTGGMVEPKNMKTIDADKTAQKRNYTRWADDMDGFHRVG